MEKRIVSLSPPAVSMSIICRTEKGSLYSEPIVSLGIFEEGEESWVSPLFMDHLGDLQEAYDHKDFVTITAFPMAKPTADALEAVAVSLEGIMEEADNEQ